ncbi:MAG: hypothetical protein V9F04_11890 [Dermatophilaceae bacterium]
MRTDDQGAGARRPTRTGVAVVGVMGVAALALLAASGFALTLLARPIDRDKATAASFVLGAVGGAFMSFALTTGGALGSPVAPTSRCPDLPRHDRCSRPDCARVAGHHGDRLRRRSLASTSPRRRCRSQPRPFALSRPGGSLAGMPCSLPRVRSARDRALRSAPPD